MGCEIEYNNGLVGSHSKNQTKKLLEEKLEIALEKGVIDDAYEWIPNNKDIKPYFDIDIKPTHPELKKPFGETYQSKEKILDACLEMLKEHLGDDCEFAISEASEEDVIISYHIVVHNKKTTMKELKLLVSSDLKFPFDKNPYISKFDKERFQKFRLVYCYKEGKRQLKPITNKEETSLHFISNPDKEADFYLYKHKHYEEESTTLEKEGKGIGLKLIQTDDRTEWLKIGTSLFVIYGEQRGGVEFRAYSQNWDNSNQFNLLENCNIAWNSIVKGNYTNGGWGLLKKYLPEEYHKEYIQQIPPCQTITDIKLATWFLDRFSKYKIKYCDGIWYKFQNNKWSICGEGEIFKDMAFFIADAYDTALQICDEESRDKIRKMSIRVGGYSFLNSIVKIIRNIVEDTKFTSKLNQNRELLAFDNGVLDLRTKEFRDGRDTDYISYSCNYDYVERDKCCDEKFKFLETNILNMMCGNKNRYEDLMNIFGRSMIGDNSVSNQKFYCLFGLGRNGKTSIQELIQDTFGDYYKITPTSLLTQDEARADGHNADIQNLSGVRFCFMSETKNGYLNSQSLKKHTGEDILEYRAVYGRVKHVTKITWTPFLTTNYKVTLNNDDFGIMRRFVYLPFNASFKDNANECDEESNNYLAIDNLKEKLSDCKLEFLHLLLDRCVANKKLVFSEEINNETRELIHSQDMLLDMLVTLFTKSDNPQEAITWKELHDILRDNSKNPQSNYYKKLGTNKEAFKKVNDRMNIAFNVQVKGTGGRDSKLYHYIDSYGNKKSSRRLFYGIKINDEDGGYDNDSECAI
jgi:P4 family phage/plasmid primase-like protien